MKTFSRRILVKFYLCALCTQKPRFSRSHYNIKNNRVLTAAAAWGTLPFCAGSKVIHPKYSKPWLYLLAATMCCICSKILNHGLNHGLFLSLFMFFVWKYILNWIENSGLKCRVLYCIRFLVFLEIEANLPETSPFFSCPNGCAEQCL